MPNNRSLFVLTAVAFVLAGCRSAMEPSDVQVRVRNASALDFESVAVQFPGSREEYGALAAGEATDYRAVETAYRIATVEVRVEGEVLRLQVIDYVGETPLPAGRYTYRLIVAGGERLELELVEG